MDELTQAGRVRALAAERPELSQAQLSAELGLDRRHVHAALSRRPGRGRPPSNLKRITLAVPTPLLDYARKRLEDDGHASIEDVLLAAVEAGLVPAAQREAYLAALAGPAPKKPRKSRAKPRKHKGFRKPTPCDK